MTIKNKTDLQSYITTNLADNNAGLISAEDIRVSVYDIVDSINVIVASGDFDTTNPFVNDVRISNVNGNGNLIVESGINFGDATWQYTAYPGADGVDHSLLLNRGVNSAHNQYLTIDGTRPMAENLPMADNWIGASGAGSDDKGLKFITNGNVEDIHVGSSGSFVYHDNSTMSSAQGVAKAWLSFDGSGNGGLPVVKSYYNILAITKDAVGKYTITIPSGILADDRFVAIGTSNARTSASSAEDFAINSVGIATRTGSGGNATLTFLVLNEAGDYVDAERNDLLVYGFGPTESSGTPPIVS